MGKGLNLHVFVKNMKGLPLMPTSPQKARLLLKLGKAQVDSYRPFTIKLCNATGESKQNLTLGVDAGMPKLDSL